MQAGDDFEPRRSLHLPNQPLIKLVLVSIPYSWAVIIAWLTPAEKPKSSPLITRNLRFCMGSSLLDAAFSEVREELSTLAQATYKHLGIC